MDIAQADKRERDRDRDRAKRDSYGSGVIIGEGGGGGPWRSYDPEKFVNVPPKDSWRLRDKTNTGGEHITSGRRWEGPTEGGLTRRGEL